MLVEKVVFLSMQGKDIIHGTTEEPGMRFVALPKTGRATVPVTPVEFVDGLGRCIEPVDSVTSVRQRSFCACRRPLHVVMRMLKAADDWLIR